jgi:hypothetical protein
MPKFNVPVTIEIQSYLTVDADDPEAAIELAKDEYDRRWTENMKGKGSFGALATNVVDSPDVQIIFADGDDPTSVYEDEG